MSSYSNLVRLHCTGFMCVTRRNAPPKVHTQPTKFSRGNAHLSAKGTSIENLIKVLIK